MRFPHPVALVLAFVLCILASSETLLAVTPGVDVAAPRVAIVTVASAFVFNPNLSTIEQGDYVQWKNIGTGSHTTTAGSGCTASGTWNFSLGLGAVMDRQFLEAPGNFPYFCIPHCMFGMTGSVRLTPRIALQAQDNIGTLQLSWTGGGTAFQVFRSDVPTFATSSIFPPDGGDAGTSFTDATPVAVGAVAYYLVINK